MTHHNNTLINWFIILFLLFNLQNFHNVKGMKNYATKAFINVKVLSFFYSYLLDGVMFSKDVVEITKG